MVRKVFSDLEKAGFGNAKTSKGQHTFEINEKNLREKAIEVGLSQTDVDIAIGRAADNTQGRIAQINFR